MAIRLFSAGKEIGPYSESQVRQYLGEGLIAPTDFAADETSTEWERLDELLARLAPAPTGVLVDGGLQPITIRATTTRKSQRGQVDLQAILDADGSGRIGKRPRTGKTAISIEPPRPTTQLPPVAKFQRPGAAAPTDQRPGGNFSLSPESFYEKFGPRLNAPVAKPVVPAEPPPPVEIHPGEPDGDAPSTSELAPVRSKKKAPEISPAPMAPGTFPPVILYTGTAIGVTVLVFLSAVIYFFLHLSAPAPRGSTYTQAHDAPTPSPAANPETAAEFVSHGLAREANDLNGAMSDFDRAVALDSRSGAAYFRRGLARQTKGDWEGALADYNTLLEIEPQNADGYCNRGFVKQARGDLDGALADYSAALKQNPKIAVAFYDIGLIKSQRGDLDGGIEAYNRATELDPKITRAYYNRGNAKNTEGNLDGAIADYTQALALDPKIALAYYGRGSARQAQGDLNGAIGDYSQAIALDSQLGAAYFHRGEIRLQRDEFAAALADSAWAIELDPKNAAAYNNRGLARYGRGDLDGAASDLKRFCDLAPREAACDTAHLYLWVIAAQQNHRDLADQQLLNATLTDWNSSPEDLISKIAAFLLGHTRESELVAAAAAPDLARQPAQYCKVWYFVGMKHSVSADNVNALAAFQKAIATGQKTLCEYLFSKAEAQLLGQSRQASSLLSPATAH